MIYLDAGELFLEYRQDLFGVDLGQGSIEIDAALGNSLFVEFIRRLSGRLGGRGK